MGLNITLVCNGMQNANESQNPSIGHKQSLTNQEETKKSKNKKKKHKKEVDGQSKEEKIEETIQILHGKHGNQFHSYAVSYICGNALPTKFAPVLSPSVATLKVIDNLSKRYKQLGELKNLIQIRIFF